MRKGILPRFQEPLQLECLGCAGRYAEVTLCCRLVCPCNQKTKGDREYEFQKKHRITYSDNPPNKRRIHGKIPRRRKPCRLALQPAPILVAKVRVQQDPKFGLRDQERRQRAPHLRPHLRREHERLEEDICAERDDAAVACRRDEDGERGERAEIGVSRLWSCVGARQAYRDTGGRVQKTSMVS
jgi:hypothetical protein